MALSVDIVLPRDRVAEFPSVCCRCLRDYPEHRLRYSGRRWTWWDIFFVWLWWFRKPVRCEVPCCEPCRPLVRRRRWLDVFGLIVVTGVAVVLITPWFRSLGLGRQWQRLAVFGGAVLIGMPYFLLHTMRPPTFDLTVRADHVEYEFANAGYAERFFGDNEDAESDDLWRFPSLADDDDEDDEDGDDDDGDDDDEQGDAAADGAGARP